MAVTKEKYKTYNNVFDNFTLRNLFKLSSQGHFDELESPLFIGKESNVFTALKDDKRVIVKIYRLETCDFNRMYDYIKYDPRYLSLKRNKRRIIFGWTQREYRNIMKAREAGVIVPTPYVCLQNIIVMEMIGSIKPSPRLKDLMPDDHKSIKKLFDDVISNMIKLHKAGLVHADLSAFNILNRDGKPVFIDFSQSTPFNSPRGMESLERDAKNISNFFIKFGIKTTKEKIIKKILA